MRQRRVSGSLRFVRYSCWCKESDSALDGPDVRRQDRATQPRLVSELQERVQAAVGSGYRVERELGGGGMRRVFLATEIALDRAVVVTLLAPELTSELMSARFRREFQETAVLGQHPHILPVLSTGTNGGLLHFITPYIEGESLRHRLCRERTLPVDDAVRILGELGSALAFAHERGVVPRDLTPENVLLADGHGGCELRRARHRLQLRRRRHPLRARGRLLRGARLDDPGRRLGVCLHVHDDG